MDETRELFATVATADQIEAGVGVIWWATHPAGGYALTVIDYDIFDIPSINAEWLGTLFARCADLVTTHRPATRGCHLRVEHPGLINVLNRADAAYRDTPATNKVNRSIFDIRPVKDHEKRYKSVQWPESLDERAFSIRPLVDSGKVVKVEKGLRRFSFRAVRTNHLIAQIKQHRPGDAASAGELLHAFVLGVLLGTTPKPSTFFTACSQPPASESPPSAGPFGTYIQGRRPL
jgi:hypothetical protein